MQMLRDGEFRYIPIARFTERKEFARRIAAIVG